MTGRFKRTLVIAGVVAATAAGGAAIAVGTGGGSGDDDDATEQSISGSALEKASDAALTHTGGGRVTETEVGDEESYYEVEVTRDDGSQVDVQLDRDFKVVGTEDDGEEGSEDDGPDDD